MIGTDRGRMGTPLGQRMGFTLVEVMVAACLIALATVGIYGLASSLQSMNQVSAAVSDATDLTRSKVEQLRAQTYESLADGTDTVGVYTREWTVTKTAWRATVVVTTSWPSRQGRQEIRMVARSFLGLSSLLRRFLRAITAPAIPKPPGPAR